MNIAVFASGNGTNLQAIIEAISSGDIKKCNIALLVSNNKDAHALTRAKGAKIETFVLSHKDFPSREDYDKEIIKELKKRNVELVVLAGFMRLISSYFANEYRNRIMNIHPALLPAFKGTHGIKDTFEYGVKMTGVTVHFVDDELDHGPIILQESVPVREGDTLKSLEEKIHKTEHKLYPKAIGLFIEGKLKVEDRKVRIKE